MAPKSEALYFIEHRIPNIIFRLEIADFLRYLGFFDHYTKEKMKVKGYVRYMDDVLLFTNTMQEIKAMFKIVLSVQLWTHRPVRQRRYRTG
ncbi:hypothetical protein ABK01_03510 [Treponema sp. OMZ 305]|uniref:hypothetical protein n=1 Tax=Treponema TaxID=157 RepID=UPI001BAF24BD|nr:MULTISPECIES: hypothetical protein [Treponema]QUY16979.1 hypothetical protein GWP40_03560 [Treponema vincentii]UTC56805.1 hypothetical protein ABK01_03510 [Treponema sp. OMZ 305]